MKQISRRAFLRGAGASAAIVAPLSPGLVAWFAREFTPRRFYSFAGKEMPKRDIKVYNVESFNIKYPVDPWKSAAKNGLARWGSVRLSEPLERDYAGIRVPARIIDAKEGLVEISLPDIEGTVILKGDIRIDEDA